MLSEKTASLLRPCNVAALFFLIAIAVLVTVEIIIRNLFGKSLLVVEEFVGYALAAMTFLMLADTMMQGGYIRVGFGISQLSDAGKRVCEIITVIVTIITMAFLQYYFMGVLLKMFRRGVTSGTTADIPLWIPQAIVAVGMTAFLLQLFAYLIDLLRGGRLIESEGISE